jgi:glycosyltransferase involved in cell wall biosynthesis
MLPLQVSVVVPTYKRIDLLHRCLAALVAQTIEPAAFEILVVDDAPTDATRALVGLLAASTAGAPALRYLTAPDTQGPAGARNRGWQAAQSAVVAFTDDDTMPDRDWLLRGLQALADGRLCAVWGRIVVPLPDAPTDHEKNTQGLERAGFVTANCLVRRDALQRIGGFDERFRRAWREDTDLYFRLQREVGPVEHTPQAVVVHPVRPARWGISLSQQANAYFDALLYKLHPRRYRESVLPRPPWRYYFIVVATAGGLLGALVGAFVPALVLLLGAAGAIADFARLRLAGTSRAPAHVAEMLVTSAAIPFLSVYWRMAGAIRYRVPFL